MQLGTHTDETVTQGQVIRLHDRPEKLSKETSLQENIMLKDLANETNV